MSAQDALAAVKLICGLVAKVKENKQELTRLSTRLQYIIETLEDSRNRNVIREAEYNDSLTNIFDLITRTQKVTRRMLKQSVGERTWNASEITLEVRRLNEDVQVYLSVHAIKTLDFVQTAQTEHQQLLTVGIEEILSKIAELDAAIASSKPQPSAGTLERLPQQIVGTHKKSSGFRMSLLAPKAQPVVGTRGMALPSASLSTSTPTKSSITSMARRYFNPQSKPATGAPISPNNTMDEENNQVLLSRLSNSQVYPLTISGLHPAPKDPNHRRYGPGSHVTTLNFSGTVGLDHVMDGIKRAGYQLPEYLIEDSTLNIKVVEGNSSYDAASLGGLQISQNEPLLWWLDKYDEYHGAPTAVPKKTEVNWANDELSAGGAMIKFHRTLRVPDQGEISELPPNFGAFPILPVANLGSRAPEEMKSRGGFVIPMFRREAMYISFTANSDQPAVKVSVGGVNAISGEVASDPSPLRGTIKQDYIVAGKQPWLDGIATGTGVVRQFVVTELHKGYTVEEQVTGKAEFGGLQFDIYPRRKQAHPTGNFVRYLYAPDQGRHISAYQNLTSTPREAAIPAGESVAYLRWSTEVWERKVSNQSRFPWILSQYARRTSSTPALVAKYSDPPTLSAPVAIMGAPYQRRGGVGGRRHVTMSSSPALGISAGGRIKQKIYLDPDSTRMYNEQLGRRFHVHIITPEHWEDLTGVLPPVTPINRDLYLTHNIPWFKLFDDYVEGISQISEALAGVVSISELDRQKSGLRQGDAVRSDPVVDPNDPPKCLQHPFVTSSCVFRPCGHAVCAPCLGMTLIGGSKCSCGEVVAKFIGMKQPLPQVAALQAGGDEESHWSVKEIETLSLRAVRHGKISIIHLAEDDVAPLKQSE